MRLVRYIYQEQTRYGELEGDVIRPLASPGPEGPTTKGKIITLEQVVLLAPCVPT